MNSKASTHLLGLLLLSTGVACDDPDSQSLGEDPVTTTEGGSTNVEIDLLGILDGGSIQYLDTRDDGSVVAAGSSGYQGQFGDGVLFDNLWVGAYASDGGLLWEQEIPLETNAFGEVEGNGLSDISAGPDGSVFISVVDYSDVPESNNRVLKFDADGTPLWTATLPSRPRNVAPLSDGGAVVAGLALAEDDPNAVYGWAARLDAAGTIATTRTWTNDEGRGTLLNAAASTDDDRIILGGSWGTSPTSSQSEAWFLWVDADLQTLSEVRLPASGATDRVSSVRLDDEGRAIAATALDGAVIVALSPTAQVLSTEPVDPDEILWSPHSPTGFLSGDRTNCIEPDPVTPSDCAEAVFAGVDDGERQWDAPIDGCSALGGFALGPDEALALVSCGNGSEEFGGFATELRRIRVE